LNTSASHPDSRSQTPRYSGIDATKKLPGESFKRSWPPVIRMGKKYPQEGGRTVRRKAMRENHLSGRSFSAGGRWMKA
jgi:hypothetical protein